MCTTPNYFSRRFPPSSHWVPAIFSQESSTRIKRLKEIAKQNFVQCVAGLRLTNDRKTRKSAGFQRGFVSNLLPNIQRHKASTRRPCNFKSVASMASSSSSASAAYANNNYYVYDVFLNHRGPDCKEPFATDLYHRLCKHGLRVFLDKQEMQQGDALTSQIEGAIRTASVHIAIFSPRYAESTWCLKELVLMLESRATIIPVFYGVHPSELRWTQGETRAFKRRRHGMRTENGRYARSLRELEEKKTFDSQTRQNKPRYDSNTIGEWREALSNVADISGFDIETCNGEKRQLIEQVVEGVLKTVKKPLHVSKYPVDLDQKVQDFERAVLWQPQSVQTRVIGIVGLGGVGKTTLAKEIFNRQLKYYDRSCCLSDVREKSLKSSQGKLLEDLAGRNDQHIYDISDGIEKIRRYLPSSRALVILDNVDDIKQVNALLVPLKDTIDKGSLILITSRDKDVLTSSGIVESSIYKLRGLNEKHSQELFCWHAFNQPNPVIGFEEEVGKFSVACRGLPLALEVIGALLHGKDDLQYWKAQRCKISKIPPEDIRGRLKFSYDGLDEEEKHIFLDIACFFIGEHRDTAIRIWNGSGWEGWLGFRNLEHKCLAEVDSQNRITMHDHLRDLGRYIAKKEPPDRLRRLWCPTDNILNLSEQSPVRGISMVPNDGSEWRPQSFKNLEQLTDSLQLLRAEGDCVKNILSLTQSPPLIWLCWHNCPYSSLPRWIRTENLRVLQIKGVKLKRLWPESQAPVQMRELDIDLSYCSSLQMLQSIDLSYCSSLEMLPDSFGNLTNLQSINLSHCSSLQMLPDSFGNLTNLQSINLTYCSKLQMLPDSIGNLTNLQSINLSGLSGLQMLPDSIGNLTNLQSINLSGCSGLKMLPDSFGNLTNLQSINLSHCSSLQMLPDSFGNLTNLQSINLTYCSKLQMLPDSFGNLTSLQSINLSWLSRLQMLPDSIGNLTNLQSLYLFGCSGLLMLPDSFGNLTNFQSISLFYCSGLQMLPDSFGNLTNLQSISLSYCSGLQMLPDSFGNLTNLQIIELYCCSGLQILPDSIGNLTNLQIIYLSGCSGLQILPDSIRNLTNIQSLHLNNCSGLQMLPDSIGNLTNLQSIDLFGCSGLQILPDSIRNLTNIQSLHLNNCSGLQMLPDSIGNLTNLQSIDLFGCSGLQILPDSIGNLTNLQSIDLSGCSGLQMLPDSFGNLMSLHSIILSRCSNLQMFPNFGFLKGLKELELCFCHGLKCLPDSIRMLTQLRKLKIEGMDNLEWLEIEDCPPSDSRDASEVSYPQHVSLNFQHVEIKDCNGLVEDGALPATLIALPSTLITLELKGCGALRKIGGLCGLTNLETFNISECKELEELPSIEALVSLKEFCAFNCKKLKIIRGLAQLTQLRRLDVRECSKLEEVQGLEHVIKSVVLCAYGCPKLERQLRELVKQGFTI